MKNNDKFAEFGISYDENGNIKGLQRKHNNILTDDLTYHYKSNSNQIDSIVDDVNDANIAADIVHFRGNTKGVVYKYDKNGNLIEDYSKDHTIEYNYLNLPSEVKISNDRYVLYTYDAAGNKLKKEITDKHRNVLKTTSYIGSYIYEGVNDDNTLKIQFTSEGRITYDENENPSREYFLKDHLGNNRIVFAVVGDTAAMVIQETNYYPFGMTFDEYQNAEYNGNKNMFLYNGKELQNDIENTEYNLDLLDYGARFYCPITGRFIGIDPIAEKFYYVTPYNYAENSPIANIDLWGLQKFSVHLLNTKAEVQAKAILTDISKKDGLQFNFPKGASVSKNMYRNLRSMANSYYYDADKVEQKLPSGERSLIKQCTLFEERNKNGECTPEFSFNLNNPNKEPSYLEVPQGIIKGGYGNDKEGILDLSNLNLSSDEYDKIEVFSSGTASNDEIIEALQKEGIDTDYLIDFISEAKKGGTDLEIHFYKIDRHEDEKDD